MSRLAYDFRHFHAVSEAIYYPLTLMRPTARNYFLPFVLLFSTMASAQSLGEVARAHRERKAAAPQPPATAPSVRIAELTADLSAGSPEDYTGKALQLLTKTDFDVLDRMAASARAGKSRFPGGAWMLFMFYDALGKADNIGLLEQWRKARPQSATARIALAQAYLHFGQNARGRGYSNTVTSEGWRTYGSASEAALALLKEAHSLPEKCPYWHFAMLQVALAQGWDKETVHAIFEDAFALEPGFYHAARQYANYLQPKWYGSHKEVIGFAESISERIGGDEGRFVYFEIATLLGCNTCGDDSFYPLLSWPRIKEGYAALERLYGSSKLKKNRFAYLAFVYEDKNAAREVFTSIGDDWDPAVWRNSQQFASSKEWALQ